MATREAMAIANGADKYADIPDEVSNGRAERMIANSFTDVFTVLIWDEQLQSFA